MIKFLSALLGFAFIAACLVFSLFNRQGVSVSLWPFDIELTAPLFVMVLGALAIGLLAGATFVWVQHMPHRFRARRLGKDLVELSNRLIEAEQELERHRERQRAEETAQPPIARTRPFWSFWKK